MSANNQVPGHIATMGRSLLVGAFLCALLTLPVAWGTRQSISTDGLCYLDIANYAVHSPARALLTNAYWSPAYPALIAVALKLTGAKPDAWLPVVHGTQFVIALGTYLSFAWFLFNLIRWIRSAHGIVFDTRAGFFAFIALAYTVVLIGNLDPELWAVYPDMLVEGVVYLAAAVCVRLSLPSSRLLHFAMLGVILAFGYTVKAALFPLSLALFSILFVCPVVRAARWKGPAVAAAAFLLASSPLLIGLSLGKGRLTFGDVGKINYAWIVNGVSKYALFDSNLPVWETLRHHPAVIAESPPVFQLGGAVEGTLPLWDDPSYWYDGIRARFDIRRQLSMFLSNLGIGARPPSDGTTLRAMALHSWIPLFGAVLALPLLGLRFRKAYLAISTHLWLFIWPAAAVLMFSCLVIQPRYLIPFVALGWTGIFAAACMVMKPMRAAAAILTAAFALLLTNAPALTRALHSKTSGDLSAHWEQSAQELRTLGIRPGDDLATVGSAFIPPCYYCARLVGARFTYAIFGRADSVSKLPAAQVRSVIEALQAHGAKAILSGGRPGFDNDTGWIGLSGGAYIRLLR